MPIIDNQKLYNKVKAEADEIYDKPSAYKSMFIQKKYKEKGGTFTDDNKERKLTTWKNERWMDVGNAKYPVYRPTKRINKKTPLLPNEIDPENLKKQIELKQKIKGDKNLPPFEASEENDDLKAVDAPYSNKIWKVSNPIMAQKNLDNYLGKKGSVLYLSKNKDKKYFIYDDNGKKIHFGNLLYEDFTRHTNMKRKRLYLARALAIRGDWANNKYSPNNLAISVLWS